MSITNAILSIGDLSSQTGCKIETIRYYESIGLLPAVPRTDGGHRIYNTTLAKRLSFICRCRQLGFSQQQIRELFSLVDKTDSSCAEVRALTLLHANTVKARITDLLKMEKVLRQMVEQCSDGDVPDCPIIDTLSQE